MESKRKSNKPKAKKFPVTSLAFYIKLYCRQKHSSETKYQCNLIEATKSWLSLTEGEKNQVTELFKEQEHKFKLQCFDQLKNAEPFMKAKEPIGSKIIDLNTSSSLIKEPEENAIRERLQTVIEHDNHMANDEDMNICYDEELGTSISQNIDLNASNSLIKDPEEHAIGERLQTVTEPDNHIVNDKDMNLCYDKELRTSVEPHHDQEEDNKPINEPIQSSREETPRTILAEPLPPTLKTGKDLFYMLNPAGGADSASWPALTTPEKSQYRRAVSLLKADYITKYKDYLESLTPRELYNYYNKTLF